LKIKTVNSHGYPYTCSQPKQHEPLLNTNKNDHHNITEIFLKVALNTKTLTLLSTEQTVTEIYVTVHVHDIKI